ncbi:MAG: SCO family protein [Aeromicrobium sp.]
MVARRRTAIVAVVLLLAACGPPTQEPRPADGGPAVVRHADPRELSGTAVDPPLARPTQTLLDTEGQGFSFADRPEDELTVAFFGYTHCPDLCPTTMADLATALRMLPDDLIKRVTVAFVTEDPDRDTSRALRSWLDRFDPSFVGLIGGNRASRVILKELYSTETRQLARPEKPIKHPGPGHEHHEHGSYGIEHTGTVYAFGPGGTSVIYTGGTKPSEYAADFTALLEPAK